MKLIIKATIALLGICSIALGQAVPDQGEYLERVHTMDGESLNYRIMYPHAFDASQSYPLVLFMHGAGERGDDNKAQLVHGSKLFQDSLLAHPAIVVFPQCPKADFWAAIERGDGRRAFRFSTDATPTTSMRLVMDLVTQLKVEKYIDPDRLYVGGLSMGGMGTWEILWRMPDTFAAAMPICGGGAREKAEAMTTVPIWAFHGKLDDVVPPRLSVNMVTAVQSAGGKAKITIYPEANHNSWDPAFAEPEFLTWMFSKKRNDTDE